MKIKWSAFYVLLTVSLLPIGNVLGELSTSFLESPSNLAAQISIVRMRDFFDNAHIIRRSASQDETAFYSNAMALYINKVYNRASYAGHLSQDGTHVTEFLSLAEEFELNAEAVYTGLRLFFNKYKEAEVIDDSVVCHILQHLPEGLAPYFPLKRKPRNMRSSSQMIENVILSQLTELPQRTRNQELFCHDLSEKIASILDRDATPDEEDKMRERLRTMTIRFVESIINKMIWYTSDFASTKSSFITCAHYLHLLGAGNIVIHQDDIDDLLWSLVHRFCFFLRTSCDQEHIPPLSFYEDIEKDLNDGMIACLEGPELDYGIKSKKEFLLEALLEAKARAVAYHKHGIVTSELHIDK